MKVLLGASLLIRDYLTTPNGIICKVNDYFRYYPFRGLEDHLSNLDRHMFLYFEYHTVIIIEPIITPNSE
jgi:hypothetical protein